MLALYADGSCLGNPGPGGAAWLLLENGRPLAKNSHAEASVTTNNQMELRAAIDGLLAIGKSHNTPCEVALRFDSRYVLDGIFSYMEGWKKRAWSKVKNPGLWKELDAILTELKDKGYTFTNGWVKGHDPEGDVHNHMVDAAAGEASAEAKMIMEEEARSFPLTMDCSASLVRDTTPAPDAQTGPSDLALLSAQMLLMVARDPSTTPADFYAQIKGLRANLGL